MRAAIFAGAGGPEVIDLRDVPRPDPGPDQVLVRVQASALNRADLNQRQGSYPAPPGAPADIPGLEYTGIVEACGADVRAFRSGQRVFGLAGGGGQAEYLVSHERLVVPVPDNLDPIAAAAVPEAFITAHDALFTWGGLASGERVLIHVVGSGVGTAAVQLARAAGCTVFGTSRTADKLKACEPLGLDVGIDTSREDFAAVIADRTEQQGVNVCLDMIGEAAWDQTIAALAHRGRLVLVGTLGGSRPVANLGPIMRKRLQITGTVLRSRPFEDKILATRRFADRVVPLLARGALRPIVDRVFPLEALAEAHRYLESNASFGKVVIAVDPGLAPKP